MDHLKVSTRTLVLFATFARFVAFSSAMAAPLAAQNADRVDFRRDVQPLFKHYCLDCHGPRQQMSGLRLDRRRDAMRGGAIADIGPGNSAASRLYLKLIGNGDYGGQMPPTGPLKDDQIRTIKNWIDQGAEWPDDLAGEASPKAADPKATRLMESLRTGDRVRFRKLLKEDRSAANRQGYAGSTPLMFAALYADSSAVALLLRAGADPNIRNDAGASPLMWAVPDIDKTRLLLDSGANVNARSGDGRTPLLIAASYRNSSATLELLLHRGAEPNVTSSGGAGSPLAEAAYLGDLSSIQALLKGGVDLKHTGDAVGLALWSRCLPCALQLVKGAQPDELHFPLELLSRLGDEPGVEFLLDHGADPKAVGMHGRTPLMYAAASDTIPLPIVKALVGRGADINVKSVSAESAIGFARLSGDTPVVTWLVAAGATPPGVPAYSPPAAAPCTSPRSAIERSVPLLQRSDLSFLKKAGCVSCHNNMLTAMTVSRARKKIGVDEDVARTQLSSIAIYLDAWRERLLQNIGLPGDADGASYLLLGLAAENYPPSPATDAAARFLASRQLSDGSWRIVEHRPPLESSDIEVTAVSMRALQVYAPKARQRLYGSSIQLAATWLSTAQPRTNEDRALRLLGLSWGGATNQAIRTAAQPLLDEQRADGGWAQIPTLPTDAYATGQALVALLESGAITASSAAFARGVQFLQSTQLADGSWYVKSRAAPFQPYFESGFPHHQDQWISDAATNWATMALTHAVQ